ncbi:hypothetical protein ANANG_G00318790, partial [Anguilla anguilla]
QILRLWVSRRSRAEFSTFGPTAQIETRAQDQKEAPTHGLMTVAPVKNPRSSLPHSRHA